MHKRIYLIFFLIGWSYIFNGQINYFDFQKNLDSNRIAVKNLIEKIRINEKQFSDSSQLLSDRNMQIKLLQDSVKRLKTFNNQKTNKIKSQNSFLSVYLIAALIALVAVVVLITTIKEKKYINKQLERQHYLATRSAANLKEKNKEITDSIKYARRIQEAMLPTKVEIKNILPNCFVYYRPKDIVSGDFYWLGEKQGKIFVVTADCTGHGVPGALMSMLGISSLNEIINEKGYLSPAKILNELRNSIINSLSKTEGDGMKDGMDMSIYCYDKRLKKITYSAANNGIYVVRDNTIIMLNPDKQPVGYSPTNERPFTEGTFELKNNDFIVTFTDGFADQFGGPKGKKFKYKQLQQLLIEVKSRPIYHIAELLNHYFLKWKGKLEQVDDVLIIGVKV